MNNESAIIEMLRILRTNNIYSTKEFEKDLTKLVNTNVRKFVKDFTKDITRESFDEYNRYKQINLTKAQRIKLDSHKLYRYEYRSSSNLRCIYLIDIVQNTKNIILLCAFNEDGDKTKGNNAYNNNIERAIRIYLNSLS